MDEARQFQFGTMSVASSVQPTNDKLHQRFLASRSPLVTAELY